MKSMNHSAVALLIISSVAIAGCGSSEYKVGGTVTGLKDTTEQVELTLNESTENIEATNGKFSFTTKHPVKSEYKVVVNSIPPAARCTVQNAQGVIGPSSPSAIKVDCPWLTQTSIEFDETTTIESGTVDSAGNVYISGRMSPNNAYIQKFDAYGNITWTKIFDPNAQFLISDIDVDSYGNIYGTGTASTDFSESVISLGGFDTIVLKLNSTGETQWVRFLGGPGNSNGYGVHISGDTLFVSGTAWDGGQYEGQGPVDNYRSDIVVSALQSSSGDSLWHKKIGNSGVGDRNYGGLVTDTNNDIIMMAYISGNNFIYRLSSLDGTIKNQKLLSKGVSVGEIQMSSKGGIVLAGKVEGSFLDFEPYAERDTFIMEVDADFNITWVDLIGSSQNGSGFQFVDVRSGVSLDSQGNVLISGTVTSGAFKNQVNHGGNDSYVGQWSPTGQRQLLRQFGTVGRDLATYSGVLPDGSILVGGRTNGDLAGDGTPTAGDHHFMTFLRPTSEALGCVTADNDQDGICDDLDSDDDNDGVRDHADTDPLSPAICEDSDKDGCDDCSVAGDGIGPKFDANPANDGIDTDNDGQCNVGDADDDNDGFADTVDVCPLIVGITEGCPV